MKNSRPAARPGRPALEPNLGQPPAQKEHAFMLPTRPIATLAVTGLAAAHPASAQQTLYVFTSSNTIEKFQQQWHRYAVRQQQAEQPDLPRVRP